MKEERLLRFEDFDFQGDSVESVARGFSDGKRVHAYLITGPAGVGKRSLAGVMARSLLCTGSGEKPCNACPACLQVMKEEHPDLVIVRPGVRVDPEGSSRSQSIVAEDIRALNRIAGEESFTGRGKAIIIEQADKMLPAAANSLLKTLEEPAADVMFLLLTENRSMLLPTIVSRCRPVQLHPWPDDRLADFLREREVPEERIRETVPVCGGSAGKALQLAADEEYWQKRRQIREDFFGLERRSRILGVSAAWKDDKEAGDELLDILEDMVRQLMLVRLGLREKKSIEAFPTPWQRAATEAELSVFAGLLDAVQETRKMRLSNVNWQAALEKLMLRLMEERTKWST